MPNFEFTLIAILRELEDGLILAEAPGYPEVSRLGDDPEAVLDALAEEARRIIETDEPLERYRRRAIEAAEVGEVALTIEPAERSSACARRCRCAWRRSAGIGARADRSRPCRPWGSTSWAPAARISTGSCRSRPVRRYDG